MTVVRSISLYGLSDVRLTFQDGTDHYFARQQVFERLPRRRAARRRDAVVAPLFSPSGLVYRYVLESPDRIADGAQDHQRLGDRAAVQVGARRGGRRGLGGADDAVPGAARSDQARRRRALRCRDVVDGARRQQRQRRAAASTPRAASSTTCAASAGSQTTEDIGNVVLAVHERHAGAGEGRRAGRDRPRAPARPVRLQRPERRRRGRHPDAHRRAGADGAQGRRGQDPGAERQRSCRRT